MESKTQSKTTPSNLSNNELDNLGRDIVEKGRRRPSSSSTATASSSSSSTTTTLSPKTSRLLLALNFEADRAGGKKWGNLDPIFRHSKTGAMVFCGNTNAAQSKQILSENGITRVVNCKDPDSPCYHEKDPSFEYLRFPIAYHYRDLPNRNRQATLKYFGKLHNWVDAQLSDGKSVLIHCLAGAHRAGTASVSYMMYAGNLSKNEAIAIAQRQRPVICPIGSFPALLDKLESALHKT